MVCAQTRKKEEKVTGVGARRTGQRKGTLNSSPLLGYHEVGDGPASEHLFLSQLGSDMHPIFIAFL